MDESIAAGHAPARNAYGRVFRERATWKIVIGAAAIWLVWYIYSAIHTNLLNQVKWPALQVDPAGLTVLGLQDVNRPGKPRKYVAIFANYAIQIRRPDDEAAADEVPDVKNNPEAAERGNDPGASHHAAKGEIVELEEVMKNCPVFLVGRNFSGASLRQQYDAFRDKNYWDIYLDLTEEGQSRYFQFSQEHGEIRSFGNIVQQGERAIFVLKNEIVTGARIEHMNVGSLKLGPIWVKEDAQKLADFINAQH
jgi:hypothetical protein